MNGGNDRKWHFSKQMNISGIVQIVLLASLIIGTWVNLQQQIGQLGNDVTTLLKKQEKVEIRMEALGEKSIGFEYRISGIERQIQVSDFRPQTSGIRLQNSN